MTVLLVIFLLMCLVAGVIIAIVHFSKTNSNLQNNMTDNIKPRNTPKDVFLHLFNIFTFYLSVVSFITLYIQYIAVAFPDPLNFYFNSISNSVRVSSSILFVAIPAYIFTSWLFAKEFAVNPERRDFKLRKWLIYFTLFVAAVTIIIDLMIFIYNFLSGELTTQFFLKILVVLLVAAAVFGYYIWDLKRTDMQSKVPKTLAIIMSLVVLISIVLGFFIVGTPNDQRKRRFDEQRIYDLQNLQSQIINHWIQKDKLPTDLAVLKDDISGFIVPTDPNTKGDYEYRIISDLSFELCATFEHVSDDRDKTGQAMKAVPRDLYQQNWSHNAERTCFERTIDPDLYKDQKNLYLNQAIPPYPVKY